MDQDASAAQPSTDYTATVLPAWIDDNDHMNLAYYVLVFTDALAAPHARIALGGPFRITQMHTVYEREVTLGDDVLVRTHVLAVEERRLHLFQEMTHAGQGYRAATYEAVAERDVPLPAPAITRLAATIPAEPPPGAGRYIAMTQKK